MDKNIVSPFLTHGVYEHYVTFTICRDKSFE